MQKWYRRCWVPALVTAGIMGMVIARSDWRRIAGYLQQVELGWLAGALTMFFPLVLGSALRWRMMVRPWRELKLRDACEHVLAAAALNLALPSKLGDFGKAAFLRDGTSSGRGRAQIAGVVCTQRSNASLPGASVGSSLRTGPRHLATKRSFLNEVMCSPAVPFPRRPGGRVEKCDRVPGIVEASAVVAAEKVIDLFALILLLLLGALLEGVLRSSVIALGGLVFGTAGVVCWMALRPPRRRTEQAAAGQRPGATARTGGVTRAGMLSQAIAPLICWRIKTLGFVLCSAALWTAHLAQIAMLFLAVGINVPVGQILVRVPLAIVAGLVPWTIAGIGTRDTALLFLFSDAAPAAALAAVGMLTALRYLVPGAVGAPLLYRRLAMMQSGRAAKARAQRHARPSERPVAPERRAAVGRSALSR